MGSACTSPRGCSNADVREFWAFCHDCGKKIKGSELLRCDYHRPFHADMLVCSCKEWWHVPWPGPEWFDPFAPTVSMRHFLEAGVPEPEDA